MRVEINQADLLKPAKLNDGEHNLTVIGDLHGSALKLLHLLTQEVASVSSADYKRYIKHYFEGKAALPSSLELIEPDRKLVILGDDLGDRGANDAFTLELFDWMHRQKLNYSVIFSNHTLFFLEVLQDVRVALQSEQWQDEIKAIEKKVNIQMDMGTGQAHSLVTLLNSPRERIEQAIEHFNTCYLPHLKLLDYCYDEDENVVLFSHAPIHLPVIEMLAKGFRIWPKQVRHIHQLNRIGFECLINDLNKKFQEQFHKLDYKALNDMVGHVDIKHLKLRAQKKLKYGGLALISWNRSYDGLVQHAKHHHLKDATVSYVHGHDPADLSELKLSDAEKAIYEAHYVTLDNKVGKGMNEKDYVGDNPLIRFNDQAVHQITLPNLLVKMI